MLALDTEDNSKGGTRIINFFDGEKHYTFTGKTCRVKAWDWLAEHSKRGREEVWAVNAEYDLINLFGYEWIGKLVTMQYVSSGLMCAFYREGPITFFDTLRHWAKSVSEMGEYIGLPKLKADFESITYCRRDTEIVYFFVQRMLSIYESLDLRLRSTLPAMAMQLFKKFYRRQFPRFEENEKALFHRGYYGGRNEVYRFGSIDGPINHYDINSLFPTVMLSSVYPSLRKWSYVKSPDFDKEGIIEGWVTLPYCYYPCLPVREEGEIVYPYGGFFGAWTYPEIRQFLLDGGRIIKIKNAIEFSDTERPFSAFVEFCYGMRQQSGNKLENLFWKLMLNSLYGKFAQSKGVTSIYYSDKLRSVVEKSIPSDSSQSNVIWSAYVTAYARLYLLKHLRSCSEVFYTDTDSLFTRDTMTTGSELGAFKLEGIYSRGEFSGNKLYIVDSIVRAKGVPNLLKDEKGNTVFDSEGNPVSPARDFIRTGRAIFRRPARYREARKTFARANYWYEVEKRRQKVYTKRQLLKDGKTEPWRYGEYKSWVDNNGR